MTYALRRHDRAARYHQILWKLLREVRILQLHEAGEQSPTTGGYAWAKDARETAAQQGAQRVQERPGW
jgi:hypothetical protein